MKGKLTGCGELLRPVELPDAIEDYDPSSVASISTDFL